MGFRMYDVAVVGAGPAGATTARYLAMTGLNVCMIDKDQFPRDKACGGGFSLSLVDDFPYLKNRQSEFLKGVCRVGVLHSPNMKRTLKGRVDMAVALRTDFDNVLFELAEEAGAKPLVGKRVKSVTFSEDNVEVAITGGQFLSARVVVGADGVTSIVAREAGLNKKWRSGSITACRVAEIPATEKQIVDSYTEDHEYHFFANVGGLPGYGWVFPKKETINVGLGIVDKHSAGLPKRFQLFIQMLKRNGKLGSDVDLSATRGALIPTGGPLKYTTGNRCVLVGDSAGMVNPLTGGGIAYAMNAGRIAAATLKECIENDSLDEENLKAYHNGWKSDFGHEFRPQLMAQRFFTGSFASALFEIGSRDTHLQETVTSIMSEGSGGRIGFLRLLGRFLFVCVREALRL
ncbi:MAG: geranylgeranyl reductase family protein [Candidatus Thorarchaeota archaeon]